MYSGCAFPPGRQTPEGWQTGCGTGVPSCGPSPGDSVSLLPMRSRLPDCRPASSMHAR